MTQGPGGHFVGSRPLQVADEPQGLPFPALLLYPTAEHPRATAFGPYLLDVSPLAAVAPGRHPLVVLSHGNGGSHLAYRTLCMALARHGFVVVAPEHPGNNRNDNRLEGTLQNLVDRPRHVSLTMDAVLAERALAGCIDVERVAVIGHSIGGYTALAVAGGRPHAQIGHPVSVVPDERVRALVLLAPATAWYGAPESLRAVKLPILMMLAEHDAYTPRWHADRVLDGVADRAQVDCRTVSGAGHFSFLSPFPPAMTRPEFLPSNDPEGFDREAFHRQLPGELRRFLVKHLIPAGATA